MHVMSMFYCMCIDFKHFMKAPDEPQDQVVEVEKSLLEMVEEMEDSEVYDKLRILSSLAQFQIKIFKGEPKLVSQFLCSITLSLPLSPLFPCCFL